MFCADMKRAWLGVIRYDSRAEIMPTLPPETGEKREAWSNRREGCDKVGQEVDESMHTNVPSN